jgi:DNA-binding SARP family transcriptional activator/tetratricopeptide (TPR) repeat protein
MSSSDLPGRPDRPGAVRSAAVQIFAFGELAVTVDGVPVAVGPPKQRAVLGLLLARPGVEVSSGELIDALWGSPPPASAANNLRTYVHGLRRVLGGDLITGNGRPGYRLHTDLLWTDTGQFLAHCADAESSREGSDPVAVRAALAAAVALRRGPAFGDLGDLTAIEDEASRWEERWLRALEQRVELDLDRGHPADLVGELTDLVSRHPYRERFVAFLMLALYRSGRQTDALAVYRRTATALTEELGVEPGAELTELHRAMLRQDAGLDQPDGRPAAPVTEAAPTPAELPSAPGHFTGRTRESAALTAALADARQDEALPIIAVVGPAGVGKTSLVVEWARTASADFPDGQIFADLRGFSAEPVKSPAEALRRLLWSLGVDASRAPGSADEAGALLRSLLAGKRMLMVLDNVASAAQVAPLLPGGSGNAVIVTSRNRLAGLVAGHGARQVRLEALAEDEALGLIERIVGPGRVGAEAGAARELVERCGRLPLALCIAAANIAEEPDQTIAAYLAEHRAGTWIRTLRDAGDPDRTVMAAFDLSLRRLTAGQQRLLVLLGLVPGPSFTVDAVAALAGGDRETVDTDLRRLVNAHFVERAAAGRYTFHDLIREYARSRSSIAADDDRAAAAGRLYDYYRDVSDAADRALQPGALRLPPAPGQGPADRFAGDRPAAQSWFADEQANLIAACRAAGEHGTERAAIRLADAAGRYLWTQGDLDTWSAVAEAGVRAAVAVGDVQGLAAARIALARIADGRCDFTAGVAQYGEAVELARQVHWREGEGVALGSMAALHGELGNPELAVRQLEAALAISRESGDRLHEGRTLQHLGAYRAEQGELELAADLFGQALAIIDEQGSRIGRAIVLTNMAGLCLLRRDFDQATRHAEEALHICDEVNHLSCRVSALINLSAAARGRGAAHAALPHVQQALALSAALDTRELGSILNEAAEVYDALGEDDRAIEYYRAAHRLTATAQTRSLSISNAIALALAEHRRSGAGEAGPGTPDLDQALEDARRSGYRGLEGAALAALAEVSRDQGDAGIAADYAERALRLQRESGWRDEPELLTGIIAADRGLRTGRPT